MKASRTGLNLCSMAIGPRGSHHSAARAEKRATSATSTVEPPTGFAPPVINPSPKARLQPCGLPRYVYAPFRARACRKAECASTHAGNVREPAMARLVMKFGGTSVADIEHIHNVARVVQGRRLAAPGHQPVGCSGHGRNNRPAGGLVPRGGGLARRARIRRGGVLGRAGHRL